MAKNKLMDSRIESIGEMNEWMKKLHSFHEFLGKQNEKKKKKIFYEKLSFHSFRMDAWMMKKFFFAKEKFSFSFFISRNEYQKKIDSKINGIDGIEFIPSSSFCVCVIIFIKFLSKFLEIFFVHHHVWLEFSKKTFQKKD